MVVVMNATNEEQVTKAVGNWFTFKPGQYKIMEDSVGNFLTGHRSYLGFVELPIEFAENPEFALSAEGKAVVAEKKKQGVAAYVTHLRKIAQNCLVSLKQDLKMANIETDPRALASDGELKAMELLAKYQSSGDDEQQARIARITELEKKLGLERKA